MSVLALLAAVAMSAGAPEPITLSVDELQARHRELVGKTVLVRGWLTRCNQLDCTIANIPRERAEGRTRVVVSIASDDRFGPLERWIAWRNGALRPFTDGSGYYHFSIGGSADVILEATVTDHCWPAGREVCFDRAPQIHAGRILRVFSTIPEVKTSSNEVED